MKYYDIAISLGGSCAEAGQLAKRELRPASMPFDWLWSPHTKTIKALAELFRNDFSRWLDSSLMVPVPDAEISKDGTGFQYYDSESGYYFIHDFYSPIEKVLDDVRSKYQRRIERMLSYLGQSTRIALLYDSSEDCGVVPYLVELRKVLMEKYPNLQAVDVYFWQYKAPVFEEMHEVESGIYVMRVPHGKSDYIFKERSFEYACMDEWRLTGKIVESGKKGSRLYMRRSEKGGLIVLWKNIARKFRLLVSIGQREYEFRIGT